MAGESPVTSDTPALYCYWVLHVQVSSGTCGGELIGLLDSWAAAQAVCSYYMMLWEGSPAVPVVGDGGGGLPGYSWLLDLALLCCDFFGSFKVFETFKLVECYVNTRGHKRYVSNGFILRHSCGQSYHPEA